MNEDHKTERYIPFINIAPINSPTPIIRPFEIPERNEDPKGKESEPKREQYS